ncbi:hypothetical protein N431DRAFT_420123 [Stipitochalara longipes BDJ]|nr:hypothetical protein N431DRAFT_420123 [Stipitochalara longipes BDJ]
MFFPPLSNILLALTILFSTYLTILSQLHPNAKPNTKDTISPFTQPAFLALTHLIVTLLALHHAFLTLSYPSPPSLLCPNATNLTPSLFTWSPTTSLCLLIILLSAPLRLLAFRQLGPNFTFQLREPGKLVTTGLYRYVQHPSYTAVIIVMLSNLCLLARIDGSIGCWVGKEVVASGWWKVFAGVLVGVQVVSMGVRVWDEERMLRGTFGKEWEVWHARTRRFVPGLF